MADFSSYSDGLKNYTGLINQAIENSDKARLEHHFECLRDWNVFHNLSEVKLWFNDRKKNCKMDISEIPISDCENWLVDPKTMNITH